MKPQKPTKRQGRPAGKRSEPQFDHKSDRVSRLPDLLNDWFGAHNAVAGMDAVSSGQDGRFASQKAGAAKGRR
jgi:hypothetical protein